MNTIIFTITHKSFAVPSDPMFVPLQVGRADHDDLGYIGDDTGDSISHWNPYFSELTGMYWIWKNFQTDGYVGICHYRRFLIHEDGRVLNRADYEQLLACHDLVTTKQVVLNNSYYDGYAANHHIKDLDETGRVIEELYPEYYKEFKQIVHGNRTYFGNMIVCRKELFDAYSKWLFDILLEVKRRVDVESYDDYHKRVFGFISEILLLVYTTHNHWKVAECKVGMPQEKMETREVKRQLAACFWKKDMDAAGQYLKQALKKRPDLLMEASDLGGELMMALQVITICEQEQNAGSFVLLNHFHSAEHRPVDPEQLFTAMMIWVRVLNENAAKHQNGQMTEKEWAQFCTVQHVSEQAAHVAQLLIEP